MTSRRMLVQTKRMRDSRRKAYLKKPKSAGPAVGWLDWIHGRASSLTAFENWFYSIPDHITRESANARRAELGEPTCSKLSAKEVVANLERKLRQLLGQPVFDWIKLTEDEYGIKHCMIWCQKDEYYILRVLADGGVWKSIRYYDRHRCLEQFKRHRTSWDQRIELKEIALIRPYLTGGANVPYEPPF